MRRALFLSSPETAHAMALRALRARAALGAICALPQDPRRVMGLDFPNPVGLAAGFDKNGDSIAACGLLGFGFVEVGTITPRPQNGNPRPRVFRIPAREAVVNRMGLNNCGAQQAARNIAASRARYPGVVGASVGHNDDTPPDQIAADFVAALRAVFPVADYIALNVSCPNIRNFDAAREPRALREIVTAAVAERDSLAAQTGKKLRLRLRFRPISMTANFRLSPRLQPTAESRPSSPPTRLCAATTIFANSPRRAKKAAYPANRSPRKRSPSRANCARCCRPRSRSSARAA